MATPTNFYKNSAYAYAREFDLSSVLDNLHAYRLATGAAAAPEAAGRDKEPGSFEAAQKVETTKHSTSRHQHGSHSEQSTSTSPSILSLKLFTSCIASMNILSFGSVTSSWCMHQFW
jgi:hypothetical protein